MISYNKLSLSFSNILPTKKNSVLYLIFAAFNWINIFNFWVRTATPRINIPILKAPRINTPRLKTPRINTPILKTPRINIPRLKTT